VKARPAVTLRAVAVSEWTPSVGRAFARVGIHWTICCEPGAEIGTDGADAAEIAMRYNAFPHLVAALARITTTADRQRAVVAANEALAYIRKRDA